MSLLPSGQLILAVLHGTVRLDLSALRYSPQVYITIHATAEEHRVDVPLFCVASLLRRGAKSQDRACVSSQRDVRLHVLDLTRSVPLISHELADIPQLDCAVFAGACQGGARSRHELQAADNIHVGLERADWPEELLVGAVPWNIVMNLLISSTPKRVLLLERGISDSFL